MTARTFVQLMVVFVALVVMATLSGRALARLRETNEPVFVASKWKGGKLVGRTTTKAPDGAPLDEIEGTLVFERVLGESWLPAFSADAMSLSLVASRDGVRVDLDGKTAYVTPDDLLARQAYDHGLTLDSIGLTMGVDMPVVVALAAERLGKNPIDVQEHARFRRIRTERVIPGRLPDRPIDESSFDDEIASRWVLAAARHLARGVSSEGRFRYLINVPTNQTLGGYDWPRHAGATYFLAQAAAHAHAIAAPDATTLDRAALRAAMLLATHALSPCGTHKCIGEGDSFEIGSAALTTVAFAEIVSSNLDTSFKPLVHDLAETIASLQRPDGEFMHEIHKDGSTVDVQLPYFSGEAALALTRAYAIFGEPRYLEGARKSVAYLTGPAWHFFGNRYYFAEEHWTCQVVGETWPDAPNPSALDFCLQVARIQPRRSAPQRRLRDRLRRRSRRGTARHSALHAGREPMRSRRRDARRSGEGARRSRGGLAPAIANSPLARAPRAAAIPRAARAPHGRSRRGAWRNAGERGRLADPHRLRSARWQRDAQVARTPRRREALSWKQLGSHVVKSLADHKQILVLCNPLASFVVGRAVGASMRG